MENDLSFTYDSSLGSSKDKLRFLISDTVNTAKSPAVFADEELSGLLNGIESNLFMAAAVALRSRAASFVDKAISYSVGTGTGRGGALSVDRRGILRDIMALAATFDARALSTPDEAFDRLDFNIGADGRDLSNYQGFTTLIDQLI